jgi:hypothetical protein
MNTKKFWMLALVMMIVASPVFAGEATQMWRCEMVDDATEEQIEAHAAQWLKTAKKVEGGENLEAYVYFPIAVNATGTMDFMFIVVAPSFGEWGKFWDNYGDSEAAQMENHELSVCPDSVLWQSVKIK